MSHVEIRASQGPQAAPAGLVRTRRHQYVRAPVPIEFPCEERWEDAVPETKRHLENRTNLYLMLRGALAGDALGSDQFVYWDATDPRKSLAPDLFVKRGSEALSFDTWKVWERGAPDLAVEIVSPFDHRDAVWDDKIARYRACGVGEVVRFDAQDRMQPVRIWDRVDEDLVERAPGSPDLHECATLGLWWVVVSSPFGPQLRLARDREGKELLPTPDEARLAAERERATAERERAVAEHERAVAEHGRAVAEQERQREANERASAERERDAALAEIARLRAELTRGGGPRD